MLKSDIDKVCAAVDNNYDGNLAEIEKVCLVAHALGWDVDEDNDGMLVIYTNVEAING